MHVAIFAAATVLLGACNSSVMAETTAPPSAAIGWSIADVLACFGPPDSSPEFAGVLQHHIKGDCPIFVIFDAGAVTSIIPHRGYEPNCQQLIERCAQQVKP